LHICLVENPDSQAQQNREFPAQIQFQIVPSNICSAASPVQVVDEDDTLSRGDISDAMDFEWEHLD
jgi:hypothetical protein